MEEIEKICPRCLLSFKVHKHRQFKYCSKECQHQDGEETLIGKKGICVECKKTFTFWRDQVLKYCSKKCRSKELRKHYTPRDQDLNISSASQGTISELRICADLLSKGYKVFRSVSTSCPCDLAILKEKTLFRIEVTTGTLKENGKLYHSKKVNDKFDFLAVVTRDGKIFYFPDLPKEVPT